MYELPQYINSLWVVEGPFNVWSLSQWGKCSVGLLGTGTSVQRKQLLEIDTKNYVLALDPDTAGRSGTCKLINYLTENNRNYIWVADLPDGKDINDLTLDQFRQVYVLPYKEWLNKYSIKTH